MRVDLLERQREHFNGIAERYQTHRRHANHLLLKELTWATALRDLPLPRKQRYRVLEAMCGFADGADILGDHLNAEIDYAGFDYSDAVIAELARGKPHLNVWQADATTWRPECTEFDIVILLGGLHHVPGHAAEVVKSMASGLSPGGLFINYEPTHGNRVTRWARERVYDKNSLFDEETERGFSVGELETFFEDANLVPERILFPGLLSYILYYNPDAFPFLNLGGEKLVNAAFRFDSLFMGNSVGRALSFATLSIWKKA
ncbi:MAG: methyltransferase domain-containing protein [Alphaproteobacteria bacterium]|nr:methyltransferase domain-containing protein [Alphaproteobacteria bacterium]